VRVLQRRDLRGEPGLLLAEVPGARLLQHGQLRVLRAMTMRSTVLLLIAALAAPAWSQPAKKIAPEALARSREHFRKGLAAHDAGRWDEAAAEYRAAYDEAPLPELLFDLAQVQRLAGDRPRAVASYRAYVAIAPEGVAAEEARRWEAALEADIDAEERARLDAELRRQLAAQRLAEEAARPPPLLLSLPPPVPPRGGALRVAGVVTGGAGLAALGGAAYFALRGRSLGAEQQGLAAWDPGLVSDGRAANRDAWICAGAGAAAVVTGAILYYLGARVEVSPAGVAARF
jgi:tetratricopeptide (TPR) repeat protein